MVKAGRAIALVGAMMACVCSCGGGAQTTERTTAAPESGEPDVYLVTEEMGHPHIGDPAPDFEVATPEGERLRLADLRGSVVVVAFVASWCPFSEAEQPHLAALAREHEGSTDVKVVVVDVEQTEEGYRRYLERVPMPVPVYYTPNAEAVQSYVPPNALPAMTRDRWRVLVSATLVIDREGVIRYYALNDTRNFDAEMRNPRRTISELLASQGPA